MNLNHLNILGLDFKVEYVNGNDNKLNNELCGKINWQEQEIYLDNSFNKQLILITLLHEIIHALDHELHFEFRENDIDRLAIGLFQVLKENKLLVESIL